MHCVVCVGVVRLKIGTWKVSLGGSISIYIVIVIIIITTAHHRHFHFWQGIQHLKINGQLKLKSFSGRYSGIYMTLFRKHFPVASDPWYPFLYILMTIIGMACASRTVWLVQFIHANRHQLCQCPCSKRKLLLKYYLIFNCHICRSRGIELSFNQLKHKLLKSELTALNQIISTLHKHFLKFAWTMFF